MFRCLIASVKQEAVFRNGGQDVRTVECPVCFKSKNKREKGENKRSCNQGPGWAESRREQGKPVIKKSNEDNVQVYGARDACDDV